ncbi:hypothetical protein ACN28C_27495 [Plantactinospora sp. WMMC1484]|uniref:hypothetical protein n=1 Tax=Plantactinospora sp. WMMC1484 TaxID=3404122 RepID=UPI003BF617B0
MFRDRGRVGVATAFNMSRAPDRGAWARMAARYFAFVSGGTCGAYGIGTSSTESGQRHR